MASDSSGIWELWIELAKTSETLGDPVFLECLEAGYSSKIFDELPDEKLKATLSLINSILNDPKIRSKGLALFGDLLEQINISRLIGYQDAVISGLHLVIKGLESSSACTLLTNFLPKCHVMLEVNQTVVSSIIPKILCQICEEGKDSFTQKTIEEISLLKICLEIYHGPCGPFRERLEKVLIPLLDSDNAVLIECLSEVFPLLSYSGGGGTAGEKHTNDWNVMLTKFLKTTYSTFSQLYGDAYFSFEMENPFGGECLSGLRKITEGKPLLRMTFLKRRLCNLLCVLSGYLRSYFPAPKHVPLKGILNLLRSITSLNPVSQMSVKAAMKEVVFLASITSSIHMLALKLLNSLIYCVGSNIFTEAVIVEQILTSEFKWLQERPRAFEKLRLELYHTLITWLVATGGIVTNLKTLSMWTNAIGNDSRVEKDVIELKVLSKRPGKSVRKNVHSGAHAVTLNSTPSQSFLEKSKSLCRIALTSLIHLIRALDKDNHRNVMEHLIKTASIMTQFQTPPPPYNDAGCRRLLYENLATLCFNPHPQSPVTFSLVVTLLQKGSHDPSIMVSSFCSTQMSLLERIIHPAVSSMSFVSSTPAPMVIFGSSNKETGEVNEERVIQNTMDYNDQISNMEDISEDVEDPNKLREHDTRPTSDEISVPPQSQSQSVVLDLNVLQRIVKNAISEILKDSSGGIGNLLRSQSADPQNVSVSTFDVPDETSSSSSVQDQSESVGVKSLLFQNSSDTILNCARDHNGSNGNAIDKPENFLAENVHVLSEEEEISNETQSNSKRMASLDEESNNFNDNPNKKARKLEAPPSAVVDEVKETGPTVEEMMSSFIDVEPTP